MDLFKESGLLGNLKNNNMQDIKSLIIGLLIIPAIPFIIMTWLIERVFDYLSWAEKKLIK